MIHEVLNGTYHVTETIGAGGFAKVKLGYHLPTGEKVAIKVMDKRTLGDFIDRIKQEVETMKRLQHPHICQLYHVVETEQYIYLIMEHCQGGELFDYIVSKDRLSESEARSCFQQITSAVAYIHHLGFAHRDIKPENLLLDEDQNIKLIDFGLCTLPTDSESLSMTFCGSPAYAAPELIARKQYVGLKADMWSLGVLLYTLLCGFLPFNHQNIHCLYKKIVAGKYHQPKWLSPLSINLLGILLQTDPHKRADIETVCKHPWLTQLQPEKRLGLNFTDISIPNDDVIAVMSQHYNINPSAMKRQVMAWNYDVFTATYLLLSRRKLSGHPLKLFKERKEFQWPPPSVYLDNEFYDEDEEEEDVRKRCYGDDLFKKEGANDFFPILVRPNNVLKQQNGVITPRKQNVITPRKQNVITPKQQNNNYKTAYTSQQKNSKYNESILTYLQHKQHHKTTRSSRQQNTQQKQQPTPKRHLVTNRKNMKNIPLMITVTKADNNENAHYDNATGINEFHPSPDFLRPLTPVFKRKLIYNKNNDVYKNNNINNVNNNKYNDNNKNNDTNNVNNNKYNDNNTNNDTNNVNNNKYNDNNTNNANKNNNDDDKNEGEHFTLHRPLPFIINKSSRFCAFKMHQRRSHNKKNKSNYTNNNQINDTSNNKENNGYLNTLSPSRSYDSQLNNVVHRTPCRAREKSANRNSDDVTPCKSSLTSGIFGSLERGMDRLMEFLTPGKRKGPTEPRVAKKGSNVSNLSQMAAEEMLAILCCSLDEHGVSYFKKGFSVRCSTKDCSWAMEVVRLNTDLLGVHRKRIKGSSWHYKTLCRQILTSI